MTNTLKSSWRIIKSVLVFTILICLIIFMVNNREIVAINFFPFPFSLETRIFFLMLICFLAGMICGLLLFSQSFIKNYLNDWRYRRNQPPLK